MVPGSMVGSKVGEIVGKFEGENVGEGVGAEEGVAVADGAEEGQLFQSLSQSEHEGFASMPIVFGPMSSDPSEYDEPSSPYDESTSAYNESKSAPMSNRRKDDRGESEAVA